jgi:hypothetical protein
MADPKHDSSLITVAAAKMPAATTMAMKLTAQ